MMPVTLTDEQKSTLVALNGRVASARQLGVSREHMYRLLELGFAQTAGTVKNAPGRGRKATAYKLTDKGRKRALAAAPAAVAA